MRTITLRLLRRAARALLPLFVILLMIAAPAAGVYYAYKISGPMQTAGSDVAEYYEISPDGQYVVFVADREIDGAFNVYSAPVAGGPAVRISEEAVRDTHIGQVAISPDSTRVLYISDTRTQGKMELFSVPIVGGGVTRLNQTLADDREVTNFELSPDLTDDDFVIYRANADNLARYYLYRSPIASSDVTQVNPVLNGTSYVGDDFAIHPQGIGVVYRVNSLTVTSGRHWSLYAKDFSAADDVDLFTALPSHGNVGDFQFIPNGNGVIFEAEVDPATDGVWNLYAVAFLAPGTPVRISDSTSAGQVAEFTFAVSGQVVVYRAQHSTAGKYELYSAFITGDGDPLKINPTLCVTCTVDAFQVAPDTGRVVYRVFDSDIAHNKRDLYSVLINATSPAAINTPPMANNRQVGDFALTPNGLAVLYLAQQESEQFELYGAPTVGGAAPVKLSPPLAAGTSARSAAPYKNTGALFIAQRSGYTAEDLLLVNLTTRQVMQMNRGIQAEDGGVETYQLSPDSAWLVYQADGEVTGQSELYLVRDMQLIYLPMAGKN